MTKAEAITLLQSRADLIKKDYPDIEDYAEALLMAIEALNHIADPGKKVSSSCGQENDLIERQAALYAIYGICNEPVAWLIRAASEIEKLPSAQPEIIQCRKCKFASGDSRICMKFGHSPIGELDFCSWAERREE